MGTVIAELSGQATNGSVASHIFFSSSILLPDCLVAYATTHILLRAATQDGTDAKLTDFDSRPDNCDYWDTGRAPVLTVLPGRVQCPEPGAGEESILILPSAQRKNFYPFVCGSGYAGVS